MYYVIWLGDDYDLVDTVNDTDIVLYGPATYKQCEWYIMRGGRAL